MQLSPLHLKNSSERRLDSASQKGKKIFIQCMNAETRFRFLLTTLQNPSLVISRERIIFEMRFQLRWMAKVLSASELPPFRKLDYLYTAPSANWLCWVWLQVLPGNTNTYLVNQNELEVPFVASRVRFIPFSEHPRTVCMRVELFGCAWNGE